jgi:hypothetical protein
VLNILYNFNFYQEEFKFNFSLFIRIKLINYLINLFIFLIFFLQLICKKVLESNCSLTIDIISTLFAKRTQLGGDQNLSIPAHSHHFLVRLLLRVRISVAMWEGAVAMWEGEN